MNNELGSKCPLKHKLGIKYDILRSKSEFKIIKKFTWHFGNPWPPLSVTYYLNDPLSFRSVEKYIYLIRGSNCFFLILTSPT